MRQFAWKRVLTLACAILGACLILGVIGRFIRPTTVSQPPPAATAPLRAAATQPPPPTAPPAAVDTPALTAVLPSPTLRPTVDPAISQATSAARAAAAATVEAEAALPCLPKQMKGNRESKIFHAPDQRDYARTRENVECFDTEEAARAAGYRKAQR